MKISKKPTNWLLVTVTTDGSHPIDFILLELSAFYRSHLRTQVDVAKALTHLQNFYMLCFWDAPAGWYVFHHEGIEWHLKHKSLDWAFIEFDSTSEMSELKEAAELMEAQYISVFSSGSAQFIGTPKHTSDELYTDEFPLKDILDKLDETFGMP